MLNSLQAFCVFLFFSFFGLGGWYGAGVGDYPRLILGQYMPVLLSIFPDIRVEKFKKMLSSNYVALFLMFPSLPV